MSVLKNEMGDKEVSKTDMGVSYSKISESDDPNIPVIENALMPHTHTRE